MPVYKFAINLFIFLCLFDVCHLFFSFTSIVLLLKINEVIVLLARGPVSCLLPFCWSVCEVRKKYIFTSSAQSFLVTLDLGKSKDFPKGSSDKEPAALLRVMGRCQKERSACTVGAEGLCCRLAAMPARQSRLVWERKGGENGRKVPPLPLVKLMSVFPHET